MDIYHDKNRGSYNGMVIGKVVANYDDEHKGVVQVSYYTVGGDNTAWMRVASPGR